ncbi:MULTISPECIES: GNAT family N-acetyltransferase [unclassified Natrinema]|uniref:GNAT family N-acetyltransferase n=1 Tax=unclassified Natrinema TaxID=2622230 RepID=UPI0006780808|nr:MULTISPECIES: GNAT family N-acetyltransferase [unclassified Natrinema]
MGSELSIRRYRPDDGPRVRDLHETAMRDANAYVEGVPDDDLESITETFLESGGEFLVGERAGRIVAMGAFRPVDDSAHIATVVSDLGDAAAEVTRLRVAPDAQRRGYGRQLYRELEERARSRGVEQFVLDTRPTQTAARGLYDAEGFEAVCRKRFEDFDDPVELIVYRKSIADDG